MKNIKVFQKKKNKKQQYGHKRYKNLSEDEKLKLVEYRKQCSIMKKSTIRNYFYLENLVFICGWAKLVG